MYPPPFLFINASPTVTTFSQTTSQQRVLINRHAQIRANVNKYSHKAAVHQTRSFPGVLKYRLTTTKETKPESRTAEKKLIPHQGNTYGSTGITPQQDYEDIALFQPAIFGSHRELLHTSNTTTQATATGHHAIEHFGSPCVAVTAQVHHYLQYYQVAWHDRFIAASDFIKSPKCGSLLESSESMIHACLQNEALMYSLLANMSTVLSETELASPPSCSNFYYYQAVKAIRRQLEMSSNLDNSIIIALWHLISAEMNRDEFKAAAMHITGARAVIEHLHRVDQADCQYLALLRTCDALLGTDILVQFVSVSPFEGVPVRHIGDPHLAEAVRRARTRNDLLSAAHAEIVSSDTRLAICDLITLLSVGVVQSDKSQEWMSAIDIPRWAEISWRLVTARPSSRLMYAVSRGLGLWMYLILHILLQIKAAQPVAFTLKELLSEIDSDEWHGHEEVLIWILGVGAMVPMRRKSQQAWYAGEVARLLESPRFQGYDFIRPGDIVALFKKFFWLDVQLPMLGLFVSNIRRWKS